MARFVCAACQVSIDSPQERVKCPQCRRETVRADLLREPIMDGVGRLAQKGIGLYGSLMGLGAILIGAGFLVFALLFIVLCIIGFVANR